LSCSRNLRHGGAAGEEGATAGGGGELRGGEEKVARPGMTSRQQWWREGWAVVEEAEGREA